MNQSIEKKFKSKRIKANSKEYNFEVLSALALFLNKQKLRHLEFHFQNINGSQNVENFLKNFLKLPGTAGEWKLLSERLENETLKEKAQELCNMLKSGHSTVEISAEVSKLVKSDLLPEKKVAKIGGVMQYLFSLFKLFRSKKPAAN